MASPVVDQSIGLDVTHSIATDIDGLELLDISATGPNCEDIDVTHQGSVKNANGHVYREFIPSEIIDAGEIETVVHMNADTDPDDVVGRAGTLVVKWNDLTTAAQWSCANAYAKSYNPTATFGEKMQVSITWKLSAQPTITIGV